MPFIGRDWRSPGEAWVKTESLGWQRMKIIESQLHPSYQQNPACSWPPRSELGQHMANHCKEHDRNNDSDRSSNDARNSFSSASSSSDGCSPGNSKSPSPTCSPEKNMHHIYPITISSPYGQYSCCGHHFESGSPTNRATPNSCADAENKQNTQATLSRSLSRESVLLDSTNMMGDNSGVPDFGRNLPLSSSARDQIYGQQQEHLLTFKDGNSINIDNKDCIIKTAMSTGNDPPIVIGNGCKLEDSVAIGCNQLPEHSPMIDDSKTPRQDGQTNACCCAHHRQISSGQNIYQPKEPYVRTAPHCRISVRTREVAMYNTISEAFYRLDFCNAIHDIRRFNYICKLLHLLITQNLTSLSGCATKVLFTMLEQVAWEVSSNKRNIHVLKNLLAELKQMIQKYYCWGRPIGSSLLWQQHFDTIERISRIVDGIELSPPKNEQANVTFNNLPVEMIREILLRLNDYRDLVNSARASPVMQNMIDGQYIWKRLCRYHFTEQQLKFALDNNRSGFFTKPTKNTIRGLKYAKTTSADGTSSRIPVTHKSKSSNGNNNSSISSTKQQLERTNGRRNSRQKDSGSNEAGSSTSSSYVTRTIKIFDKEGPSNNTLGPNRVKKIGALAEKTDAKEIAKPAADNDQEIRQQQQRQQERPLNSSRSPNPEIDWERVFHQLRKKFDLKEEYADCLLLCRHCRCLFWKSFGHPCIKSDDTPANRYCSSMRLDSQPSCALDNGQNSSCKCDSLGHSQGRGLASQSGQEVGVAQGRDQALSRLSVAALSRSFDNRFQGSSSPSSQSGGRDSSENLDPESNNNQLNRQPAQAQPNNLRRHLNDNLEASLRGRHVRMIANRRQNDNENYSGSNNNGSGNNNNNLPVRREELVPKHVAVSPQAFLKFFSL